MVTVRDAQQRLYLLYSSQTYFGVGSGDVCINKAPLFIDMIVFRPLRLALIDRRQCLHREVQLVQKKADKRLVVKVKLFQKGPDGRVKDVSGFGCAVLHVAGFGRLCCSLGSGDLFGVSCVGLEDVIRWNGICEGPLAMHASYRAC